MMSRFLFLIFLFTVNAPCAHADLSEDEISELFEAAQLEELFRLRLESFPDVIRSTLLKIPGVNKSLVEKSAAVLKTKMAEQVRVQLSQFREQLRKDLSQKEYEKIAKFFKTKDGQRFVKSSLSSESNAEQVDLIINLLLQEEFDRRKGRQILKIYSEQVWGKAAMQFAKIGAYLGFYLDPYLKGGDPADMDDFPIFWEENALTIGVEMGFTRLTWLFVIYSEFPADVLKNYARFLRSKQSKKFDGIWNYHQVEVFRNAVNERLIALERARIMV